MRKKIKLTLFSLLFLFTKFSAQPDTMIVFDLITHKIDTVLPVTFNQSITFAKTASAVGILGNQVALSSTPPTSNLFAGSDFSALAKAVSFFNINDYPIRTAVALRTYSNGISSRLCSGMMVAPGFVLSAGHCACISGNFKIYDSVQAIPAYNNGTIPTNIPSSMVKKTYIFKTYYDNTHWDDIALYELKQPIGIQTGWVGIGFNSAPNFITNKVFHKFSYPGAPQPSNPSMVYNGDTLYYNYGYIDETSGNYSINSSSAEGVPGQSGSSFLYTDNADYYSVGVFNFSTNYIHFKINNAVFYQLQNIIVNNPLSVKENKNVFNNVNFYPNPFQGQAVLEFEYNPAEHYVIQITDGLGRTVETINNINNSRVTILQNNLTKGLYFLQLNTKGGYNYNCKIIIN
ncbi:MAG: T9SS type A sorting domain-containing protein [Bacteroidetes bacterium]|nr:T9SS type A sorting domain-containing protein [Bacteroidota bacterium]